MKKLLINFFYLVFLPSFCLANAAMASSAAASNDNSLQFYFLIDADTQEVLLSKNADIQIPPSSMTKIMTAYVVFDQIKQGNIALENQCLIGKDAWRKSGSSMFLNYGDVVTIDQLLQGLLAVSGNDAAIALAQATSGGMSNFITLMNSKARELGLKNSQFKNPHGLYEAGHYMSLRDLASVATALLNNFGQYQDYLGIRQFTYRNITQQSRNPLIKKNYEGSFVGGKTGHTNEGGYGVIGIVKRQNRRLIAVVNKAKTPKQREQAVIQLLNYGFDNYKKITLFDKNQTVAELPIWLGEDAKISAVTNQEISLNLQSKTLLKSLNVKVKFQEPLYAPITKGDKVADLIIEVEGKKTLQYPLFAKQKIVKAGYLKRVSQILRYKFKHFL
jgi:D-alanyl-D-alanine carboxypeptidase (penicillin-binding protein 5/6)